MVAVAAAAHHICGEMCGGGVGKDEGVDSEGASKYTRNVGFDLGY